MLIIQHVVSEVFYFLFLALLMIVAFAQCMTMIFNDPGRELEIFKDFGHSCGTLFIAMLGILDEGEVQVRERERERERERGREGEGEGEWGCDPV